MYKSVVREGKFWVIVVDGLFDSLLMELPTKELADQVAFELQTAWDQGESLGARQMREKLDSERVSKDISEVFLKVKSMNQVEKEIYQEKMLRLQSP
ncbi:hypothetical protein [Paenibacillus aestuarii]|uniref:PPM-type phosphatase domain-containing protein n=1 Tax=Paenibacillus aestuarii TaxID=516965 RepID=A0ABW0K9C1_9BACL|nr:hypothetical protein [Paenibacillus aestuarii]